MQITGKWDESTTGMTLTVGVIGVMLAFVGVFVATNAPDKTPFLLERFIAALFIVAVFLYVRMIVESLAMRQRIKQLNNSDSIGSRFGVDAETLNAFAEAQGIKPRYNINGEDFYDLKDCGDAAVLLRASVAPAAQPETLLRPTAGTMTPAETLLRPSALPQTAQTTQTETQNLTNGRSDTP